MVCRKLFFSFLFCIFISGISVKAQMQPARKVTLDVDTAAVFNVRRSVVWNLVKDPSQWNVFLGERVIAFESNGVIGEGPENPTTMEIKMVFSNGTERKLKVKQFTPQYRFIILNVVNPVQAGITDNFIGITLDAETETSCKLAYRIKVDGPEPSKSELLAQLKKEMRLYIDGISRKLSSIPH